MSKRVLLVHGLWMRAPALMFWYQQLKRAGFSPEIFTYSSLLQTPELAIQRLRALALAKPDTHIVAHSLGGLIAVNALADAPEYTGKIICVGTPLRGSQVVSHLPSYHLGKMIGRSLPLLCNGLLSVPQGLNVSVLAGIKPHGLGRLIHHFSEPNDGTVALSETQLPGLTKHIQVNASHSGQLFSKEVIQNVLAILASH